MIFNVKGIRVLVVSCFIFLLATTDRPTAFIYLGQMYLIGFCFEFIDVIVKKAQIAKAHKQGAESTSLTGETLE